MRLFLAEDLDVGEVRQQADEAIVVVARVLENEAGLISSAAQKLAAVK